MSLRRYDVQAKVSLMVSLLAGVGFLGQILLLWRRYNADLGAVVYSDKSLYSPAFFLGTAGVILLSFVGLILGFNSAGQRRNDLQGRSWTGFFLGTAVLAGATICFAMFWFLRMPIPK